MMQWIGETVKEIKNRTGDNSQFEHSMTAMNFEMTGMRTTMDKMSDIRTRDQRTDEKVTKWNRIWTPRLEKNNNAKFEEKLSVLETKMEDMKTRRSEATAMNCDRESLKEGCRNVPIENKAVATGLKEDSDEKEVKALIQETISAIGLMEVTYTIDCPATPLTHTCLRGIPERKNQRQIRQISKRATAPVEWKSDKNTTSYGRRRKISMEAIGVRKICSQQKKKTGFH